MKVWLIESGQYEDRGPDGIVSSPEAAAPFLERHMSWVTWGPLTADGDAFELRGAFETVGGYKYETLYTITPFWLDGEKG